MEGLRGGLFDTKVIKGPPQWTGQRDKWRHWSQKTRAYVSGVSPALVQLMRLAETQEIPITHDGMDAQPVEMSHALWSLLNGLCEGDAYDAPRLVSAIKFVPWLATTDLLTL